MKFISEDAASKATPAKVIKYVMNPAKCCKNEDGEILMSAIGMDNNRPYSKQFREIAELAGNEYEIDDRKYYHFKHTVSPEDYQEDGVQNITPEQLLRETEDLVLKMLPGYQALITVQYHDNEREGEAKNKKHLHAHIVLNASSFDPEKTKLDLRDRDLDQLRDYAYEAGLKFNLNEKYWRDEVAAKREAQREAREQSNPEPINKTKNEKKFEITHGKNFSDFSWKQQYRIAVDEAKGATTNIDSFQAYLKEHFQISTQITNQGNIKYKFPYRKNYTSGKALGSDYELGAVEKALAENRSKPSELPQPTREQIEALEWKKRYDEEAERFRKWEEEYRRQQQKWQRTDKKNEEDAEYKRDRTILENTATFYRICEEAANNEALAALLTDKQREEMAELVRCRERLIQQEQSAGSYKPISDWQREFEAFRKEMINKFREDLDDTYQHRRDTRSTYYDAMRMLHRSNNLVTSLVAFGVAMYSLKKEQRINQQIEDLQEKRKTFTRNTSDPETFYKAYGSDIAAGKMPGKEYLDAMGDAYKAFERVETREKYIAMLQTTSTSLSDRISAAQGIRDMNIEEGKKSRENELYNTYGTDTRKLYARRDWQIQRQIDSVRVARELGANNSAELELKVKQEGREYGKIKREYTAAKKQYDEAVNTATAEITNDSSLSVEEQLKKVEEIKTAEYEKLRPIEEKFNTAKEHYKKCARALDTAKAVEIKNSIYYTEVTAEPTDKQPEGSRRSKEEAKRDEKQQWAELREWSDEATWAVAQKPGKGRDADLKEWAAEMEKHGCQIRITQNTVSIKHPNSNQAVRSNRLGDSYKKEAIINDISVQRESDRTQRVGDNNRTENNTDWRAVAATATATIDSKREAASDERGKETGAGKQPTQREFDGVQREIRGIEQNVAQSAFGNRTEQQPPKPDDTGKTAEPTKHQHNVRSQSAKKIRRDER